MGKESVVTAPGVAEPRSQTGAPLVSVVMPSYNHARFVASAIESVRSQTYRPIELVVVDDSSTDGSAEVIRRMMGSSPIPMRLLENPSNRGVSFSLARAIAETQGEYVAILASDDLFAPGRFENQVAEFSRRPNLQLVYGNGRVLNVDGTLGGFVHGEVARNLIQKEPQAILKYLQTNVGPFFLQTALIRRALAVDAFDPSLLADDWAASIRMFSRFTSRDAFDYDDSIVCYYRQHGENAHRNIDRQVRLKLEMIGRFTPPHLKREAEANIFWDIGASILVPRPGEALSYLVRSQIRKPSLSKTARLSRQLLGALGRRIRVGKIQ